MALFCYKALLPMLQHGAGILTTGPNVVNPASCLITNVTERGIVASEIMLPEEYMRRSSVEEYMETTRQHYTGACRTEKSRLLDECIRVTGYHRKLR